MKTAEQVSGKSCDSNQQVGKRRESLIEIL